ARLAVVKASILEHIDRTEEGVVLMQEAAKTFLRFGDRSRYVSSRMMEASLLYGGGAVERALETWQSLEGDPGVDDAHAVRLRHNIALCLSDLHRHAEAAAYVQGCVAQFEMLGMDTERTRSRWLLAHALLALGKTQEAIPILRQTWREFETLD